MELQEGDAVYALNAPVAWAITVVNTDTDYVRLYNTYTESYQDALYSRVCDAVQRLDTVKVA